MVKNHLDGPSEKGGVTYKEVGESGLGRDDRVLVRYGRFAGRVGKVEDVFSREDAGRLYEVAWVRFSDRSVECFDPKNLIKQDDPR